jgi:monoamine oxidase
MASSIPAQADVLVVGAGLAGLAAAVTLQRAGLDVQVLEARERPGGRVRTLRTVFDDGLFAEAGAEFIAAGHTTLRRYLAAYDLACVPRPNLARTLIFAGRRSRAPDLRDFGGGAAADAVRIQQAAAELSDDVPDPAAAWQAPQAQILDGKSLGGWLGQLELDPTAAAHRAIWTTIDYGVEPANISLLMFARDERLIEQTPDRDAEYVPGGLDRLPTALAAELGDRLHLDTPVAALEWSANDVMARSTGVSESSIRVGRVIVALPTTVLGQLQIRPALPAQQRAAQRGLRYCQVVKVHLQFARRFWHDDGPTSGLIGDLPFQSAWDSTQAQPGERGILTTYTAGSQAGRLRYWSERRRIAWCLEQLELLFPGCSRLFERGVSPTWASEASSRGAYSYFSAGELTRFAPWLAEPAGPLYFAGEHTDQWQSTMNGALASGERAAAEVLASLGH